MSEINVSATIDRLKVITEARSDMRLSKVLGVSSQGVRTWRERNVLGYEAIVKFAIANGYDIKYIFTGSYSVAPTQAVVPRRDANTEILFEKINSLKEISLSQQRLYENQAELSVRFNNKLAEIVEKSKND